MTPLESVQERIVELIAESGPVGDAWLGPQIVDSWEASDVAPHTQALKDAGLIEESEAAPGRWQVTDAGRQLVGR